MAQHFNALAFAALAILSTPQSGMTAEPADLALVLAIDCSYSVDQQEYSQQIAGLATAFRNKEIIDAIADGASGAIAVSVVQWSHAKAAIVALPWTRVDGLRSSLALSLQLETMPRLTQEGATSLSGAIRFASGLLEQSPFPAPRHVIDISADGRNNSGERLAPARAQALDRGITINGLAITNEVPTLHLYFERSVIGGANAFVVRARSYQDYVEAMQRKILTEIRNLPLSYAPQEKPSNHVLVKEKRRTR